MKTVTEWFRELEGWRREVCCDCGGHGLVSHYTLTGDDFLGAADCDRCAGAGVAHAARTLRALPGWAVLLGRK